MTMKSLIPAAAVGVLALALQGVGQTQRAPQKETMASVAANTYEHLATAIIEIEKTEDELVKSILLGYHAAAQNHLKAAQTDQANRKAHLEAAAASIANLANEGDGQIRAIRQRLAQAGHTHNTDVETKEDYMFITNREKKGLLELAQKAGSGAGGQAETQTLSAALAEQFAKAIAPE
jgi:hypothetical protein